MERWVLIEGNPVDGMNHYGPFESAEEAGDYGNDTGFDYWWVTRLWDPEDD